MLDVLEGEGRNLFCKEDSPFCILFLFAAVLRFFDCSGSTVFKYCGVSPVTPSSVAAYMSHHAFLAWKEVAFTSAYKINCAFPSDCLQGILPSSGYSFTVKWLLQVAGSHPAAAGTRSLHSWSLQLITPRMRGAGFVKGIVLVFLAATRRKLWNPQCLVEFLWPFANFLDARTC